MASGGTLARVLGSVAAYGLVRGSFRGRALVPSVFAAWIFAFIISFDEVIVTLFLAGAYDTIPKRMFNELILQVNPTITAIATLLIALSTVTIAAVALLMHRAGVLGRTVR